MFSLQNILQFSFFASSFYDETPKIRWGACNDLALNRGSDQILKCANLSVPLDYTEPSSNEKLSLELIKVPASHQPSKGSILFNFGGPGFTGRSSLAVLAPLLLANTGGQYDLIAFDPRGTGNTIPFSCADSKLEAFMLLNDMILGNSSDVALGRLWARGTINADMCFKKANQTGSLIGTAFVARDLMSIVDALDEDGMLRYWGFSYGTLLGATVAAMFPDRIDKMILDGVQNPHDYYHSLADFQEWTDSDKVFSGIFSWCVASPDLCDLSWRNSTAIELEEAVWTLLDQIKYHPVPMGNIMLDYTNLKALIVGNLYSAYGWQALTTILDWLLTGTFEMQISSPRGDKPELMEYANIVTALMGIHCSDRTARASSFDEMLPTISQLYNTSRIMGDVTPYISMTCAQWKMGAKERYEGDFEVQTKNPVLFIGNTYDGLTPLVSAYNVSSGFNGSVVLEVNGYGHSSISLKSECTRKTTSEYWLNGILPEPGTVCEVDTPVRSNVAWANAIRKHFGNDIPFPEGAFGVRNFLFPFY